MDIFGNSNDNEGGGFTPGSEVDAGDGNFSGNVVVTGNLTVQGDEVITNVSKVEIEDPLLHLGKNNSADTKDQGYYSEYQASGKKYSGLIRDASDKEFYLFNDLTSEPSNSVSYASNLANANVNTIKANIGNISTINGLSNVNTNVNTITWDSSRASSVIPLSNNNYTATVPSTELHGFVKLSNNFKRDTPGEFVLTLTGVRAVMIGFTQDEFNINGMPVGGYDNLKYGVFFYPYGLESWEYINNVPTAPLIWPSQDPLPLNGFTFKIENVGDGTVKFYKQEPGGSYTLRDTISYKIPTNNGNLALTFGSFSQDIVGGPITNASLELISTTFGEKINFGSGISTDDINTSTIKSKTGTGLKLQDDSGTDVIHVKDTGDLDLSVTGKTTTVKGNLIINGSTSVEQLTNTSNTNFGFLFQDTQSVTINTIGRDGATVAPLFKVTESVVEFGATGVTTKSNGILVSDGLVSALSGLRTDSIKAIGPFGLKLKDDSGTDVIHVKDTGDLDLSVTGKTTTVKGNLIVDGTTSITLQPQSVITAPDANGLKLNDGSGITGVHVKDGGDVDLSLVGKITSIKGDSSFSGVIESTNDLNSTNLTNGALHLTGGASIVKDLHIGSGMFAPKVNNLADINDITGSGGIVNLEWDPADSSGVTLSGGNKIASHNGSGRAYVKGNTTIKRSDVVSYTLKINALSGQYCLIGLAQVNNFDEVTSKYGVTFDIVNGFYNEFINNNNNFTNLLSFNITPGTHIKIENNGLGSIKIYKDDNGNLDFAFVHEGTYPLPTGDESLELVVNDGDPASSSFNVEIIEATFGLGNPPDVNIHTKILARDDSEATDLASGSIICSGGAAITKNLRVGNEIYTQKLNILESAPVATPANGLIYKSNVDHLLKHSLYSNETNSVCVYKAVHNKPITVSGNGMGGVAQSLFTPTQGSLTFQANTLKDDMSVEYEIQGYYEVDDEKKDDMEITIQVVQGANTIHEVSKTFVPKDGGSVPRMFELEGCLSFHNTGQIVSCSRIMTADDVDKMKFIDFVGTTAITPMNYSQAAEIKILFRGKDAAVQMTPTNGFLTVT